MRGQHGEAHRRFDLEEMGESARIYVDIALAHLSTLTQRNLWKAIHFGMNYGMAVTTARFVRYSRLETPLGPL